MSMSLDKGMMYPNYGRVKNVDYKEGDKFVKFMLTTFRKWKNRAGEVQYTNSAWRAKAIGKAKDKVIGLEDKTRITLISAYIENRVYKDKDSGKVRTYLEMVVFDCEITDSPIKDNSSQEEESKEEKKTDGVPF